MQIGPGLAAALALLGWCLLGLVGGAYISWNLASSKPGKIKNNALDIILWAAAYLFVVLMFFGLKKLERTGLLTETVMWVSGFVGLAAFALPFLVRRRGRSKRIDSR